MKFPRKLVKGTLIKRYKRFLADVRLADGTVVTALCPNTGSLMGHTEPGVAVYLLESDNKKRKLIFTWVLAKHSGAFVNIETSFPNRVVHEAAAAGAVPQLSGYTQFRREVKYGTNSRIDILLEGNKKDPRRCYVEVKCTTLGRDGIAYFPDAVTSRGLKHLVELQKVVKKGERAVQFFFCSRTDVATFRPEDAIDPEYGKELRRAAKNGVEVIAWRAKISLDGIELETPLPVDLS
ncbi:MAG: DNA/RNA nuclease SfsA [Planctomycetota bacterium]